MYKRSTTASRRKEANQHWLHVSVVENLLPNGLKERQLVSGTYKAGKPKLSKTQYKAAKRARPRPPKATKKEN